MGWWFRPESEGLSEFVSHSRNSFFAFTVCGSLESSEREACVGGIGRGNDGGVIGFQKVSGAGEPRVASAHFFGFVHRTFQFLVDVIAEHNHDEDGRLIVD